MTIAATLPGVVNVSLDEEKKLLTVIGEGIDAVELVNIIRKKVGFANIVNQGPVPVEKKEEKEKIKVDPPVKFVEEEELKRPKKRDQIDTHHQQKVVIRLSLNGNDQKCRTKAFKIAVSQSGVESAAITGDGKNQLEVVGEVDAATLTSLLRKNLGQADLVSVGPAGGGPAAAAPAPAVAAAAMVQSQPGSYYYAYPSYQYPVYQVTDSYGESNCSIM
ncbi:hypothetical protein KY290_032864 [Solanum tuberosum]|uniref:HMA domain-containing protein n=1 Tax=Solanum tuberosum TaxID=4113 RepID=A0ABQ7UEY4_SOLTU|nr:hypothetical protein KY290_032864 [Solanum tuberosum]